ncbi:threonine--tRNA ligase [Patescibacteria group bacterium]|nr:threonine--tRNA ligase [Patescibacteria group bacterium]
MEPDQLFKKRHSLAHILAMAVLEIFPEAKLAIGPPIDNGFYYDFDLPRAIQPEDLPDLKKRMEQLAAGGLTFTQSVASIEDAKKRFEGQPYKLELINDLAEKGEKEVSLYTSDTFTDLCKGPHVGSSKEIAPGSFALSHAAGAYWRGDEKRPMLQRIYGLAFDTPAELSAYQQMMEEAKRRDHRVLGPQLGIYMTSDLVGAGLPLWMPKGETVKHLLQAYMREKEQAAGYQYVSTPVLAHEGLYQRSGHARYYADEMYSFVDDEGNKFFMKPMNCPHHHMIFEKLTTSYRDLPLRLAEAGWVYRKELSGTLSGLIRVRGTITQNDAHIYTTPEQLKEEFAGVLRLFKSVYDELGITGYWFRLSLPDFENNAEKYAGDQAVWENAAAEIRETLMSSETPFVEVKGEASFYGPKVDVQIKNVTGKEDTIATCQVDILVPQRMNLTYIDEQGNEQHPIVIHRAILGSYERFTAFLLEQTAGNLPFWLAPVQVVVIAVSDRFNEDAEEVAGQLRSSGIRVEVDDTGESVGKKIRNASLQKIPAKIVIGQQEVDSKSDAGPVGLSYSVKVNWRSDLEDLGGEVTELQELREKMVALVRSKRH